MFQINNGVDGFFSHTHKLASMGYKQKKPENARRATCILHILKSWKKKKQSAKAIRIFGDTARYTVRFDELMNQYVYYVRAKDNKNMVASRMCPLRTIHAYTAIADANTCQAHVFSAHLNDQHQQKMYFLNIINISNIYQSNQQFHVSFMKLLNKLSHFHCCYESSQSFMILEFQKYVVFFLQHQSQC